MSIIKTTIQEFLTENKNLEYKEIEFVCHNSDVKNSTDINALKGLYKVLQKLEVESDYKIKPYMQDFSDNKNTQLSLAVIILDKQKEKYWEKRVMTLAKKLNVSFDLYNYRNDKQVDSIIKGEYFNNLI